MLKRSFPPFSLLLAMLLAPTRMFRQKRDRARFRLGALRQPPGHADGHG